MRLVEAFGLWRGREWAQWFALLSGALYLPGLYSLLRHPRPLKWAVPVANAANIRSEADFSHAVWLMRLSYLRYALKRVSAPRMLLAQATDELGLSPQFESLLEPFIPSTTNHDLAKALR